MPAFFLLEDNGAPRTLRRTLGGSPSPSALLGGLPPMRRSRPTYYGNSGEQALKDLLVRFFGCDGRLSWKLTPETSAADNSAECELED